MESSLCFLKLSLPCAWPLQNFLDGRTVFIFKPVCRPCTCGCTFANIFIHSAWSNLCHIKINCLFLYLCSWTIFLDSALLHCCYLEFLALLLMFLLLNQSVSCVQILPHLSFSFLELSYKLISHNVFKHVVCYGVMVWFQLVFFDMDISAWMGTLFQKQRRRTQLLWML